MRLALRLLRGAWPVLLAAVGCGMIGGLSIVGLVLLIQSELRRSGPSTAGAAAAFFALCLVGVVARVLAQAAIVRAGQRAIAGMVEEVSRRLLRLSLPAFERVETSAVLAALTEDVVIVAHALGGVPQLCVDLPIVLGCFAFLGWVSPLVLACGLAFAALAIAAHVALASRALRQLRAARTEQDALVGHLRGLIDGFRELKLHDGRRSAFLDRSLVPTARRARARTAAGMTLFAIVTAWGQLAYFGFLGVVLFVLPGPAGLDRPALTSLMVVLLYLMTPLNTVVSWLPVMGAAWASLGKLEGLLPSIDGVRDEDSTDVDVSVDRPKSDAVAPEIRLEAIRFAYEGDGFALGPIDLTLRGGEVVLLAGGNGTGKTTLVKLLCGLYPPDSGSIRIDGRTVVGPADRAAYRRLFTVLFADGHLFGDLAGVGPADPIDLDRQANAGLERLGLGRRVRVEGGRFDTIDLSQGQRGRLAVVGALLEGRPVCVFDEWAAHQDPRARRFFYRELLPELRDLGKAVLVISHDEMYYDAADRVVRMDDGRLAEGEPSPGGAEASRIIL